MYPALNPIHEPKPLVTGWATQRVTEKFNRGLTAIQTDSRTVYLSWRLLAEDAPQTSFNIYREEKGKKGTRINKMPQATTTDFKDQLPGKITGVSYYVIPVIAGKEQKPSEKVSVVLSQEFKNYRSIKLQGDYKPQRIALAIDKDVPGCRNWIFWDADKVRESIVSPGYENSMWDRFNVSKLSIVKYKGDTLETKILGSVIMMADLQGDWREELITILPGELRIYATTIPAKDRRVCLMQDPFYRAEIVHRSMGYEQSPVTSYYLGE